MIDADRVSRPGFDGLAVDLGGGQVLIGRRGSVMVAAALDLVLVVRSRSTGGGGAVSEEFLELRQILAEVAARSRSAADGASNAVGPRIDGSLPLFDPVDTAEAAAMLNRGVRNVTDLCSRGSFKTAVRLGRAWFVERDEVAARAAGGSDNGE